MLDTNALIASIQAGEDTELEPKEVVFRGNRVAFARDESRAGPRLAEVFVSMANTDGNTADSRRFTGPLPEQIAQVITYFGASPLIPTMSRKDRDGHRDYPSYAHTALQEAVVNAVVHRDYEERGSQIIIRLFPDRIEWRNPGVLYNTLTVENLYAGCQPARRNQFLAGFMRDYKSPLTGASYREARGEGFLRLVRDSERLSGRRPRLEQIGDSTKLTIFAASTAARLEV